MTHEHGEEFPREATRALVGAALRTERRRAWIQDLAIAIALALLALGSPTERLISSEPIFPAERAGFLASAVCFALGWLVLARSARRNGWENGSTLRASFAAALLPPVLLAATTPGPAAIGWLGGCGAVALLTLEASTVLRVLGWAAVAGLLGPALLAWPPGVWLAPLAWLGMLELEKRGRQTGWILALATCAGIAGVAWVRASDPERGWRARAEEQLEPSDLVLTASRVHARLLAERYGIEVGQPEPAAAASVDSAHASGRRIVLDEEGLEGLDATARAWAEHAATARLSAR